MKKNILFAGIISLMTLVSCKSEKFFSEAAKESYTNKGNKLVKNTFDTLSHSLKNAIAEKGFDGAVSFCKINAYPLTATYTNDSVVVSRTSLKFRNPGNQPNAEEVRILNFFASQKEKGIVNDSLKPVTEMAADGSIHFYKPIILQQMCAGCHGDKKDVAQQALWNTVDSLYPKDMAYGYQPGDLRGIWHVSFLKKDKEK